MTSLGVCLFAVLLAGAGQAAERVTEISVHGNALTPDAEVIRLAAVTIGMPFDDRLTDTVAERLRATKRFQKVEVLKRFASIADPSQVLLVIVVDEGPVEIKPGRNGADARAVKARRSRLMFLPIIDYEEGYGLSYGVRFTVPDALGPKARVSFPLAWGGQKRAAAEVEQELPDGTVLTRVQAGVGVSRREHPYFEVDDDRAAAWARAERAFGGFVRAGGSAAFERVTFGGQRDRMTRIGAEIVLDTRLDPFLARNAVYARATIDRLAFRDPVALVASHAAQAGSNADVDGLDTEEAGSHNAIRTEVDVRGYLGLVGQTILVVRGLRQDSNRPLPEYLMPVLGGTASLRGFRAGTAVGDTLVGTSLEVRVPLSSPLSVGKVGVNAFIDAAAVYPKGQRLADQELRRGVGAGIWFSAAIVRLNLVVAHGVGGSTRAHLATAFAF